MTMEEMKQRKIELGYSYEQISVLSGVPVGTVQKIFGGVTKSPRYETLRALEKSLTGNPKQNWENRQIIFRAVLRKTAPFQIMMLFLRTEGSN